MCADLSWKMRLASVLDILLSLISLRYLFEGREGSMSLVFVACVEAFHSMFQCALIRVFLCCLSADLFCFSGLRSRGGRSLASDESPSAAFFALPSTSSFPSIPECPAVHLNLSE